MTVTYVNVNQPAPLPGFGRNFPKAYSICQSAVYHNNKQLIYDLYEFKKVNVISIGSGKCTAELKVEEEHTNLMGGLHGGLSASLVDSISTFALTTHKYGGVPHVSVNINMEYIKGAKTGDEIEIVANTLRVGRTLAFLEVEIKEKSSGALLVKGSHTKYLLHPQ